MSYCLGDAIRSLIFWRGQVHVCKGLDIPLHSFLFFCFATTLVEKPYLAPPFFLLSIAWFMLATQTFRRQHPSPWNRCHSLWHYIAILWRGESSPAFQSIRVDKCANEAREYEKAWHDRLEKDEQLAATQFALQEKIDKMGDEAIHTKLTGGIPLDLIARLTRYQGILGRLCMKFRLIKIVLSWEESYLSFWITACFLAGGLVSLLLPWSFICLWVGRIAVWGIFGPHMKLLDLHLQTQGQDDDVIEQAIENFKNQSHFAIARRQEAVKLRDVKLLAFGPYSCLVPSFNLSRHYDRPLAASSAMYQNPRAAGDIVAPLKIPGQQFFGTILPRTQSDDLDYKKEMADLQQRELNTQAIIQSIKDADHCLACQNAGIQPAEVGHEVIARTGGDGLAPSKDICLADTTCISSCIVRNDKKASDATQPPSNYSSGIEFVKLDDDVSIGHPLTVSPKRDLATCAVNRVSSQHLRVATKTSPEHLPKTLPAVDEERETGEVEVILGDPPMRDESQREEDSSADQESRASMDDEDGDDASTIVYFTKSMIS